MISTERLLNLEKVSYTERLEKGKKEVVAPVKVLVFVIVMRLEAKLRYFKWVTISTLRDANRAAVIRSFKRRQLIGKDSIQVVSITSDYIVLYGIEYKLVTSDNWFTSRI